MRSMPVIFLLAVATVSPCMAMAQALTPAQIDSLAEKAIKTFNVPGLSVAIVKDGSVYYEAGYGVRSIITGQKMDANTLAGIASNSKAFTSAALGILVTEGKLNWDDKLTKYIPEFRMYDDYVTENFTIRDLLTHHSGLGAGAGDLLHNPDSADFTTEDVIRALHYLKPASSFRSKYAYDNILYMVAGELVRRVSGMSWADFIEKRIMQPLQMNDSRASSTRITNNPNVIDGHYEQDGKLKVVKVTDPGIELGAGGIYSSAADMAKWMMMQLNNGKYGPGLSKQLFSPEVHKEMWTPQTIIPVTHYGDYHTHFGAYGLGWFLTDVRGYLQVSHTGQDDGMISEVSMIPELNLGIVVLTNKDGGGAVIAMVDQLTDAYLGIKGTDHIREMAERVKNNAAGADTVTAKVWQQVKTMDTKVNETAPFIGTYHDNWFGDVTITEYHNHHLWFSSKRSIQLKGEMFPYGPNTWVVKWNNRSFNADAFAAFKLNASGKAEAISMKPISPATSFAYDFHDLDLIRVK